MEFLTELWLPILLNGIVLFFASFAAWMILPHHFGDLKKLPNEEEFVGALREMNIPAGNYMFPYCEHKKQQSSPEYAERYKAGPRGVIGVWNMPSMGANMGKTVVFFLISSAVIAYVTYIACPPGPESQFMKVFRVAGTIGILVHASSGMLNSIWFNRRMITDFIDGVVYGLIIGLIFAWMWPVTAAATA